MMTSTHRLQPHRQVGEVALATPRGLAFLDEQRRARPRRRRARDRADASAAYAAAAMRLQGR